MWAHLVQKSASVSRYRAGAVLRGLFHVIYPPACAHCHIHVASHHALCARCWGEMRLIEIERDMQLRHEERAETARTVNEVSPLAGG